MMVRIDAAFCGAAMMFACSWIATAESALAAARSTKIPNGKTTNERVTSEPDTSRDVANLEPDTCEPPVRAGAAVVGAASMYNPFRPGYRSGGPQTASGERYDPDAWTAAIQTGLRGKFGGVGYGKRYRPVYALVESADKQAIIKINDVGPLKPGRVIDLNEQTMRYFDPTLTRGVVRNVKVTPLAGDDCTPGPVEG